jgi:hypothetical protein
MMDNSKHMTNIPSRSKSLICSTSPVKALGFGGLKGTFAVVPFDGTMVAVCNEPDIFEVSLKAPLLGKSIDIAPDSLGFVIAHVLEQKFNFPRPKGGKFTDINALNKALNSVPHKQFENAIIHEFGEKALQFIEDGYPDNKRFNALCDMVMTPSSIGIKMMPFGSKLPQKREAWFSGKAVVIRLETFKNILAAIEKQKGIKPKKVKKPPLPDENDYDDDYHNYDEEDDD